MVASGEHIDWLPSGSPYSPGRMQCWIEALVQYLPIRHVQASLPGRLVHHQEIDKRRLQTSVGTIGLGEVRRLVMDEVCPGQGTPLYRDHGCRANPRPVGGARQQPSRYPSLLQSSAGERCQQIEAVAMDMNTAFDLEVKQHCPQAEVV